MKERKAIKILKKIFFNKLLTNNAYLIGFLIVAASLVRIIMLICTDNVLGMDPVSRLGDGLAVFRAHVVKPFGFYPPGVDRLPLHSYLIAGFFYILRDAYIAPRILHLLFGIFTVVPFYKLIELETGKRAAVYSTLLLVFFPLHVRISIVSLSEAPSIFFIFTSLYFLARYTKNRMFSDILISALNLMLACLLRYESWILIFVIGTYLIYIKNIKTKIALIFISITLLVPVGWMIWHQFIYENFLVFTYSNLINLKDAELFPATFLSRFLYWPIRVSEDLGLIPLLFSLVGLASFSLINKKNRLLAFCFSSLFIFYIAGSLTSTVGCHHEYIINAEVFLIPFITSWILFIPASLTIRHALVSVLTFLCIIGFISPLSQIIEQDGYFKAEDKIALEYIKEKFTRKDKIVIFRKYNSCVLDDLQILLYAYSGLKITRYIYEKENEVPAYILNKNPDCIVCSKDVFFSSLNTGKLDLLLRPFWIMEDYAVVTNPGSKDFI